MSLIRRRNNIWYVGVGVLALVVVWYAAGGGVLSVRAQEAAGESASGLTRDELEQKIRERTAELEGINQRLKETNGNLDAVRKEREGLQREINTLRGTINQLNLNIKSDRVTINKLGLEIESLRYDIVDIKASMENKEGAIGEILRRIQQNEHTTPLAIFLRNGTLAESVLEVQSLSNLYQQLSNDIVALTELQEELGNTLDATQSKQGEIERRKLNLEYRKDIVEDQKAEQDAIFEQTKNQESAYEEQLKKLREQQEEIARVIDELEDELRAAFDPSILPVKRPGVLAWPFPLKGDGGVGIITQHFGERSRLYRGRPHNGLDIGAPVGTAVMAADDGVVTGVDNNDRSRWRKYQYGKYVMIRHDNGFATLYAHLSRQIVSEGQAVSRGQVIGYSGSTGYSTGPHLHLGLYWAPSVLMKSIPPARGLVPVGVVLDPEDYL